MAHGKHIGRKTAVAAAELSGAVDKEFMASLLNATIEATADGILVVDAEGRVRARNRKFLEIWEIPEHLQDQTDDVPILDYVHGRTRDPAGFLARVKAIYASPEASTFDEIALADGRILERYSIPQRLGERIIGRVWSFRDVTARKRAENALAKSEETYRRILATATEGILIVNREGKLAYTNPNLSEMLGYGEEELRGMAFEALLFPEDLRNHALKVWERKQERPDKYERRLRRKDGQEIWALFSATPIKDASGRYDGSIAMLMDITDKKKNEIELELYRQNLEVIVEARSTDLLQEIAEHEKAKNHLQSAVEVAHLGTYERTRSGNRFFVEKGLLDSFGLDQKDLDHLDQVWTGRLHPEDAPQVLAVERDLWEGRLEKAKREFRFSDGRGRWVWVQDVCRAFRSSSGAPPDLIIGAFRNITESKQAEIALRETERIWMSILNTSNSGIAVLSREGRVLAINDIVTRRLQRPAADIIGHDMLSFLPEDQLTARQELTVRQVIADKAAAAWEDERNGIWVRFMVYPILDLQGDAEKVVIMSEDITETKRHEAQERAHQEQLARADKLASIGLLVSGVAHEVNNPNNLIMMNAGLIQVLWAEFRQLLTECSPSATVASLPLDEAMAEFERLMDGIGKGSSRIQSLIQELKNFARADSEQLNETVDVRKAASNAVFLVDSLIRKSTRNFQEEYDQVLPSVRGSLRKLEQVVMNLLTNACDSLRNPEDSVCLSVFYDAGSDGVVLRVEDGGTGIEEMDLPKLMDPFFTTKQSQGGTGLGLPVTYGIVQAHGGRIDVQSKFGQGTRVDVWLPACREPGETGGLPCRT